MKISGDAIYLYSTMTETKCWTEGVKDIIQKFVSPAVCISITWIFLHYIATHVYYEHCCGNTFYMLIMSVFHVSSPFCQGMSWVIYTGSRQILGIWIIMGTYVSSKLIWGK